jgi:hypothetical protein
MLQDKSNTEILRQNPCTLKKKAHRFGKLRHEQMRYIYDNKNTITSLVHFSTQHVSMST